jgi:mono/diheme cytochrome c family protein
MARLLDAHADSRYFREIALTGVHGREGALLAILDRNHGWRSGVDESRDWILGRLTTAMQRSRGPADPLADEELRLFELGAARYPVCSACHGDRGQGQDGVAPPLAGSAWVAGDPAALVRVTLQGLVGGVRETGGSITDGMPAHRFMSDEEIAAVLTYIRQSWGNAAPPIGMAQVAEIRRETETRQTEWTPDELRNLPR